MSVTINGTNGLVFNDNSSQASAQVGMKNRLIDAGFIINQRVYVSGTSLASGVYAHDRWKAGSGGGTYTFTQGSIGVPITITITAGSLQQVIEGCNMPEGGTYTLSWSGTAQARVNGGSYAASPITVTGLTAGANCTVEFNTGTVLRPQLEIGSTATSFDYRPYGTELALCQRYYYRTTYGANSTTLAVGAVNGTTSAAQCGFTHPVTMRASPTAGYSGVTVYDGSANPAVTSISAQSSSTTHSTINVGATGGGLTVGRAACILAANSNQYLDFSIEL